MGIQVADAIALAVAFSTFILAAFSVLIAWLLGKNILQFRSEIGRISMEIDRREKEFQERYLPSSTLLAKLEITIKIFQSQEVLSSAKERIQDFFDGREISTVQKKKLDIEIRKIDTSRSVRDAEMQLLSLGLNEGSAILYGLSAEIGDSETVEFLESLKEVFADSESRSLLDQQLGRLNGRLERVG